MHDLGLIQAAHNLCFCCFVSAYELLTLAFTYEAICKNCQLCTFGQNGGTVMS